MMQEVTWKGVKDRYQRPQTAFDKVEKKNKNIFEIEGGVGEMLELLMSMWETRDDLLEQKNAKENAREERDDEKEHIGNDLMHFTMSRSRTKDDSDDDSVSNI